MLLPINLKGHQLCQQTVCPVSYCLYKLKTLWPEAVGIDISGDEVYPNRLVQRRLTYVVVFPSRVFMEDDELVSLSVLIEITDKGLNVEGNEKAVKYLKDLPIWYEHE